MRIVITLVLALASLAIASNKVKVKKTHKSSSDGLSKQKRGGSAILANPKRIIAFGDIHGDWDAYVAVLLAAKLIDDGTNRNWIAEDTILVQTGDLCDRGPFCKQILLDMFRLRRQARKAGGAVVMILGNHELFCLVNHTWLSDEGQGMGFASELDIEQFGGKENRINAFKANGVLGQRLRKLTPAVQIGGVVFSHAGFATDKVPSKLKSTLNTVEAFNHEVMSHLDEQSQSERDRLYGNVAHLPTGNRIYTPLLENAEDEGACTQAHASAQLFGATLLVNAHNPNKANHKIIKACGGLVYSIDAAMSRWIDMPYLDGTSRALSAWKGFKPTGMLYPAYLEIDFSSGKPVATPHDGVKIPKADVTQPPEIQSSSPSESTPMIHGPNMGGNMGPNVGALNGPNVGGHMDTTLRASPHGNFLG